MEGALRGRVRKGRVHQQRVLRLLHDREEITTKVFIHKFEQILFLKIKKLAGEYGDDPVKTSKALDAVREQVKKMSKSYYFIILFSVKSRV